MKLFVLLFVFVSVLSAEPTKTELKAARAIKAVYLQNGYFKKATGEIGFFVENKKGELVFRTVERE